MVGLLSVAAASGCGGSQETVTEPKSDTTDEGPRRKSMGVSSEIGALDEGEVKRAFERASRDLMGCYGRGTERMPYLAGEVRFKLRVTSEGRVKWVYVMDSTLGDRATEDCMLGILKQVTWPKPIDGEEGLAESGFSFAPSGDERMPVEWSPDQLGDAYKKAKSKLSECRSGAGAGPLKVTLYVDTGGKAEAIGVSSADEKGEAAVACVVDALKGLKFPSPGSYASKVTVMVE